MPTGNLASIVVSGTIGGQFCQNVMHAQFEFVSGSTDPFLQAAALALGFAADVIPVYLECLPETYIASSVRVRMITPTASPTITHTSAVAGSTGTRDPAISVMTVGPLCCMPVTMDGTSVGKIFMPGVAEADITSGILAGSLVTALEVFITELVTSHALSGSVIANWKYCVANAAKDDWVAPTLGYVSPTIGTQRRRARPQF